MTESHSIERGDTMNSWQVGGLEIGANPTAKISTRCHVAL